LVAATMKPSLSGATAARTRRFSNWLSPIFVAAFLALPSVPAAVVQTRPEVVSPVEQWVVAQLSVGDIADLTKQFSDEEKNKRKLSAHFIEDLLTGELPGFKPHRNGIRVVGAIIDDRIDLTNAQMLSEVR